MRGGTRGKGREEGRGQWSHTAAGVGVAEALIASAATSPQLSPSKAEEPEVTDTLVRRKFGGRRSGGSRDSERKETTRPATRGCRQTRCCAARISQKWSRERRASSVSSVAGEQTAEATTADGGRVEPGVLCGEGEWAWAGPRGRGLGFSWLGPNPVVVRAQSTTASVPVPAPTGVHPPLCVNGTKHERCAASEVA